MSKSNVINSNEINIEIIRCFNYEKHIEVYTEDIEEKYI